MRETLAEADIKILLEGLFVDDGRDISPETRKKKTSEELCKAMNSIFPNIRFTIEVEEDFESRRLPLLDTELWVEKSDSGCFLKFSFYEKPMKNPFCIMKSSAMSERPKIQILSQDLIRRMQNICQTVEQSERNKDQIWI